MYCQCLNRLLAIILEKCIFAKQLMAKLSILNANQFGFHQGNTFSTAIIDNLKYVYDYLDRGWSVMSIFLDLSKAFDCVDHDILLNRMSVYGIRGSTLEWFGSYLLSREQYILIYDVNSWLSLIIHGVAQGSVLCLLLFLIFINDFLISTIFLSVYFICWR